MFTDYSHCVRRRPQPYFIALACAVSLLLMAPYALAGEEPAHADLTDSIKEKIHSGEIYVDVDQSEDVNRGVIIGIIQDPINEAVPYVARCWEYAPWRDNISDTKLERRIDDETIVCSGTAETPFPARDRDGHFRVHNRVTELDGQRAFISTFNYIEDTGNLEDMFGYWVLTPYGPNDEHTLLKHVLNVDLGSWIPGFLIRWATRNTLPATIWGIRKMIDDERPEPLYWEDYDYE